MPDVQVWNGYLVFSSPQVFEAHQAKYQNASLAELETWGQSLKFTSLRTMYHRLLREEVAHQEYREARRITEFSHCDYFYQNQDIFVLDPATKFFRTKVTLSFMEKFVNRDGLVQVAGHLFHYGERAIKIIKGADPTKIPLLATTNQTNEAHGIIVLPIGERQPVLQKQNSTSDYGMVSDRRVTCQLAAYTYQAAIYDYNATPTLVCVYDGGPFASWCYYVYPIIDYQIRSNAYARTFIQKKNWLDNWVTGNADYIQMSITLSMPGGPPIENFPPGCPNCPYHEVEIKDQVDIWVWAASSHGVNHGGEWRFWDLFIN
jgi:hypothetical protein